LQAYGGKYPVPFAQAIPQSPGFQPTISNFQQEATFGSFLQLLNVSTLAEARQLPTSALIKANLLQIAGSSYGGFTYGPVVDGDFVPALPGLLLLHGQFAKNIKIMVGHNSNEGLLFTSPYVTNDSTEASALQTVLPDVNPAVLAYIDGSLYPSSAYKDTTQRADKLTSELIFECNTYYLDTAFGNNTYSYLFSVSTALHGTDVPYTYYNDGGLSAGFTTGIANVTVALAMQDWFVTFARDGVPSTNTMDVPAGAVPSFKTYGPDASVELLTQQSVTIQKDDTANARCEWWQKALYY
jgi:carboxylesterase type B